MGQWWWLGFGVYVSGTSTWAGSSGSESSNGEVSSGGASMPLWEAIGVDSPGSGGGIDAFLVWRLWMMGEEWWRFGGSGVSWGRQFLF